jgi:hypothetical protein
MAEHLPDVGWEYSYIVTSTVGLKKLIETLNDLAAESWELVTMDDVDHTIGVNSFTAVIKRRIDPLDDPPHRDEGWYPDPSGRFDKRHWNGRAWTFHVARESDKQVLRDPPTRRTPSPQLRQ